MRLKLPLMHAAGCVERMSAPLLRKRWTKDKTLHLVIGVAVGTNSSALIKEMQ